MPKTLAPAKLPAVTLTFWIMKIAATTVGETGGDMLAQTLNVGYAISTLILLSVFLVTLAVQLRARKFSPALYWTVIVSTSTAGTTISDYMDRTLGLGYFKGTLILVSLVSAALAFWKVRFGSISINRVHGFELELMYWTTILCSNTLGTALGDYLSDSSGLGYGGGALLIASLIAVIAVLHFRTEINKMVLFWAAFVLTRPLGATVGDLFTKPPSKGGLGFGTYGATAVLVAVLVGLIITTSRNGAPTIAVAAAGDIVEYGIEDSPVRQPRSRSSKARVDRRAALRSRGRRHMARSHRTGRASAEGDELRPGGSSGSVTFEWLPLRSELRGRPLWPEDIVNRHFTIVQGSGYASDEVDGFLRQIAAEYRRAAESAATALPGPYEYEQVSGEISALLSVAAASAARIQAETEAMAERVRSDAAVFATEHDAIASRVDAQRMRHEAEADAARLRSQAETDAAELRRSADAAAHQTIAAAHRIQAEAVDEAARWRSEAKAEIAAMRSAAEVEAAAVRAEAERASTGIIEQAEVRAAERLAQTERHIAEFRAAKQAVADRLLQAEMLWQDLLAQLRPKENSQTSAGPPALRKGSSAASEDWPVHSNPTVTVAQGSSGNGAH